MVISDPAVSSFIYGRELIFNERNFSIVRFILVAKRNMDEEQQLSGVGILVAFNGTLKSFGNTFLLMTL